MRTVKKGLQLRAPDWFAFWRKPKDRRVKLTQEEFDEKITIEVERLLEERRKWVRNGIEGKVLNPFSGEPLDPAVTSVFESEAMPMFGGGAHWNSSQRPETTFLNKAVENGHLSEADVVSVGLSINQDPKNEQTLEKLRLQQSASRYQWINFPVARSIIENTKRYAVGRGIVVSSEIPEVDRALKNFWEGNNMKQRTKRAFQTYLIEGEYFPYFFDNVSDDFDAEIDPVLVVRSVPSVQITEIERDANDWEVPLAYTRNRFSSAQGDVTTEYYLDINHPVFGADADDLSLGIPSVTDTLSSKVQEAQKGVRMAMLKHGMAYDMRGRVLMESTLMFTRMYVEFVYDRGRLNHMRSKIFMVERRGDKTGQDLTSGVATMPMPRGGTVLVETPNREYRMMNPDTGADDAVTDIKVLLYLIGSAYSMPVHILNADASNNNYASIREAGNPFAQYIQDLQDDFGAFILSVLRYVVAHAIRNKLLEESYTLQRFDPDRVAEAKLYIAENLESSYEDVLEHAGSILGAKKTVKVRTYYAPIEVAFPAVIHTDTEKQAKALKVYRELGLISKHTSRILINLDPDAEEARIAIEDEADAERREKEFDRFNNGLGGKDGDESNEDEDEDEDEKVKEAVEDSNLDGLFYEDVEEADSLAVRSARYRKNNKRKVEARAKVRAALANGTLVKPEKCQGCGKKLTLSFHHPDYRKPLVGQFLCKGCHKGKDAKKK